MSKEKMPCFLQSIQLVNFMCHDNLLVEFSKKITCIVGNNGSGKSAIMVALGALFGVRATAMRGNSYKQYIKTGEEYSVIRATLSRKEANGEISTLVVEKKIAAESSRIRIVLNDQVVGKTQDDLNSLIEQLRINLKNPVCFLTQDQSKKILKAHNLKSIYTFFKSATDISRIEDIHVKDSDLIASIKETLERVEMRKKNKVSMLNAINNRLEMKKIIVSTEEQIKKLRVEHEWAKVTQQEKKRSETEREREIVMNKCSAHLQEKSELLSQMEAVAGKIASLSEQRAGLLMKRQSQQEKVKESIKQNEKKQMEIMKELEHYNYEIQQKTKKVQRIEQVAGKTAVGLDKDGQENETPEELEKTKRPLEEEYKEAKEDQTKLEVQNAQIEVTIKKVQMEMQSTEAAKLKKEEILQSYKFNNPMKFYGPAMERAVQDIKTAQIEATGPIGLGIQVKDKKWSRAIEVALGSCVFGFIVHTQSDKTALENILMKNGVKRYQIYLTKRHSEREKDRILEKAKRVAQNILKETHSVCSSPISTVLSQIEDNDLLVVEQLIILLGIEKIGLIDNRQDGYKILQKKAGFDFILTPSPDRIQYVGNSLSDMRCTVRDKQLLVSKESEQDLLKDIEHVKEKQAEMRERIKKLRSELDTVHTSLQKNENARARIKKSLGEIEMKIKRAKDLLKDDLEIEYRQCKEELEGLESQRASVLETHREVSSALKASQERLAQILEDNKYVQEEEDYNYKKNAKLYAQENESVRGKMQETEILIKTLQKKIDEMNNHLETMHRECLFVKDHALELSNQKILVIDKDPEEIEKELINLTAKAYAYSTQPATFTEMLSDPDCTALSEQEEEKRLEEKKTELEGDISRIDVILKENLEEIEEIERGTAERIRKREELKMKLAEDGAKSFSDLMNMREYMGELEFDHLKEELNINVKVCDSSKGNKNTLSGGERSFSGICFLLSLWPLINSPLRILDEFDVFMDGLNRKAALNLIFETARAIDSQIIIITPLGVSNPPSDICEVITLKPPIR
ncbi:structural maintenance of chromosomes protein 6 [Nematocida minor]|uniref:structural maintenance of chromosomes protein 6 n=1 Tax=Nematocida minor TaxID=1912983 RepID=UPI00221F1ABA|nr:structural maintenance of chromosomes protein 6 [Nematocida minor]KAI5189890.1 structural maintenance of chromosomes protein 6 [Nematocida minor]